MAPSISLSLVSGVRNSLKTIEPTREANPRCTLTRASRRLQKHATAAPLALSRYAGEGSSEKAGCPIPASKRARDLRSCQSFDFVRVAHFAPKEKTAAFVKCSLCGGRRGFLLARRVAAPRVTCSG